MDVIIQKDTEAVSELGASLIAELVSLKPTGVLGLATGSTPLHIYQRLVKIYESGQLSFRDVITFNLDEYIGLEPDHPQSYRSYMSREFFSKVDIVAANTHLPTVGAEQNPRLVAAAYEEKIKSAGGIDLQILGIGRNGHIGFNEPGSSLSSRTRIKTLTQSTVADNGRLFAPEEFQPQLAMTMGIRSILDARRVILFATGEQKANAIRLAVEGPLTASCPASSLQMHERATFILDEAAASELEGAAYFRWSHHHNTPLVDRYGFFHELSDS